MSCTQLSLEIIGKQYATIGSCVGINKLYVIRDYLRLHRRAGWRKSCSGVACLLRPDAKLIRFRYSFLQSSGLGNGNGSSVERGFFV
jgi:hypothetical protein